MFDAIKAWFASDSASRVGRTLAQVLGAVAVAALLDYGSDGVIVIRDYIFGPSGVIVLVTTTIATLMNLRPAIVPSDDIYE